MRNLLIMAQWDGTDFSGWQLQRSYRTVQGTLMAAIEAMVHHPVTLHASSRTDAGVHARAMPITFETMRTIPPDGFYNGLNTHLPLDVSVLSVTEKPLSWRPREQAVAKTYSYRLQLGPRRPITRNRTWWLKRDELDLDAMRAAARHLIGEHQFDAFRATGCDSRTTWRFMHRIEIHPPDAEDVVKIVVVGNAFLRNMVRILVGTLVEVGVGRRPSDWVTAVLAGKDRTRAGQTAPAAGLTLTEVHFDGYPRIGKSVTSPAET